MHTADDHLVGGLSHDRPCESCGHPVHGLLRCGFPLDDDVPCPCRTPIPGAP